MKQKDITEEPMKIEMLGFEVVEKMPSFFCLILILLP